jgi:hypothetical protein
MFKIFRMSRGSLFTKVALPSMRETIVAVGFFSSITYGLKKKYEQLQLEQWKLEKNTPPFNFQKFIPETKHAKQILLENPGMIFIGIYNNRTDEITLMPAVPDKDVKYYYNNGRVCEMTYFYPAWDDEDPDKEYNIKPEALEKLEKYRLFIPRYAGGKCRGKLSHTFMLYDRMGAENKSQYYGFSVSVTTEGTINFCSTSRSLNPYSGMPYYIQSKIETIIKQWIEEKGLVSEKKIETSQTKIGLGQPLSLEYFY